MSTTHLGPSFDIHTGGVDLIFPHHEDEIAQSEAATGQPFVRTWLHCAHLQLAGERMARREGNIQRVDDVIAEGWSPRALRYALMRTYYRSPIEYSPALLENATAEVERLSTALAALDAYRAEGPDDPELPAFLDDARASFRAGLEDDLNVSIALAALFDLVRELNRRLDARTLSTDDARRAAETIRDLDRVLAVAEEVEEPLEAESERLLRERASARAARDWAASDRLRDELADRGIVV
jgi:cysteinyl-tRNA synthetase